MNVTFQSPGKFKWSCQGCDTDGDCGNATTNRTINISVGEDPKFQLCGGGYSTTLINYTFQDSSTLAPLTTYIISSFNYSSSLNSTNKTYTYSSGVEYSNFTFCGSYGGVNYTIYPNIQYASAGYPLTTYSPGKVEYTGTVLEVKLNLTSIAGAAYQQFYVTDTTGAYIQGATITASTIADGVVATGTTDSGGSLALFLDPTKTHTVLTTKDGYPNNTRTVNPSDTVIVYITLGTPITIPENVSITYAEGVNYSITPNQTILENNTQYSFGFSIKKGNFNIDLFGFSLYNSSNGFIGNYSSTSNGGSVSQNYNVGNDSVITMIAYWVSNGTTNYRSKVWAIENTDGSGYSILFLINRLKTYISSGMFGLKTGFGLNMVCFFIILITTGIVSYKYGFNNSIGVALMATIMTAILEIGFGLIDMGNNLPLTVWAVLITVGIIIREGLK
jgi:hypothetical protein